MGPEVVLDRVVAERDLYRQLLDLAELTDAGAFLDGICLLLRESTVSERALIGIFRGEELVWSSADGLTHDDRAQVLGHISQGVLQHVISSGRTVRTSSAMLDERFSSRESVRRNAIEAVLCAPVQLEPGLTGVVYLQRKAGQGPFTDSALEVVERITGRIHSLGRAALGHVTDHTTSARERLPGCDMVGSSEALGRLLDQVASVATIEIDVLITGPSGTGKSHLARLIHENSRRAAGPFVAVNCPSVPESLFEAELFGAKAGAYTGAVGSRQGHVQLAQGGTLFLDEVGELAPSAQAKLLHLLQERTYVRVGDPQPRRADVRVIAATNLDLDEAVLQGRFRADLRYRLEVLPLKMSALQERRDDIPALATHFLRESRIRHVTLSAQALSPGAMAALVHAEWPGNVRQLSHAIEAGMVRAHAQGRTIVEAGDLFPGVPTGTSPSWQEATRAFQRSLLDSTLRKTGWNVTEAARTLDLARSHAYELVRVHGLERPG